MRPWAHLYAGPDGALWWTVRLWSGERAAPHVVSTSTLSAYAAANRLRELGRSIDALVGRARAGGRR